MKVDGEHRRTIWLEGDRIHLIDQRQLPFAFAIEEITDLAGMVTAIRDMHVRGAGLIGAAAGYGMYLAAREAVSEAARHASQGELMAALARAGELLRATRPTARNLAWAVERQLRVAAGIAGENARDSSAAQNLVVETLRAEAELIAGEDVAACRAIGECGADLIAEIAARRDGRPVEILTHCNAGWLAFVDYGTATAPIYLARDRGVAVHVWVDETRPWNQGSRLTAWELGQEGIAHTVIADSASGYLMQQGRVDLVITGADRVTVSGHVANKIGTYPTAAAAADCGVPFHVAFPTSTLDPEARGPEDIIIEEREGEEVLTARGEAGGEVISVRLAPAGSRAGNPVFDITPPRLITGYLTERGLIAPGPDALTALLT